MAVVDHHAVSDFALRGDEQRDLLAGPHADEFVVDEAFELHGRHASSRDRIFVQVDDVALPDQDATLLVAVWQEEILSVEPPVEERPVGGLVHDLEKPGLPGAQQGCFGRSHEAVFGVVVEEYLLPISDLVGERRVAVREQDFVLFPVGEVESVFRETAYGERLRVSGFEHDGA